MSCTKVSKNKTGATTGFTILELVIALTISSIVITLVFILFADTSKGILLQNKRAEKVQKMLLCKKLIDSELKKISTITWVTENNCNALTQTDSTMSINFSNTSLRNNQKVFCTGISQFSFSVKELCDGDAVLLWECTLETGGWIGGGHMVHWGIEQ